MASSQELMDKVVDLINSAKVEAKEQKIHLLAQVKEISVNRDASLLPEVIPMVAEFQTEFNAKARKYVATFMRDVVRQHPEHVALVVPVASYLMHDSNTEVKKVAVLLANTIYRPALQRLVEDGSAEDAQKDWSSLDGLRKLVLKTITTGPPDISMVAIKFAESVVLACVGGRSLAPGASRDGDMSVQRDLSRSHPFLKADTLDQAGHALARQMVGWLASSGGSGGSKASGWGTGFGAQHYTVLISALQSLATNRAALFADIVPALASALESANGKESKVAAGVKGGTTAAVAKAEVPKGLQGAASSLRSACLKLLKVAPGPSKAVQRLAEAAALSGSDGEATAAVEGNLALKGRIRLTSGAVASASAVRSPRGKRAKSPVSGKMLTMTPENLRAFADSAIKASQGNVPKPPPGYKLNRTEGFPLPDLEMLFGHVLNALGPALVALPSSSNEIADAAVRSSAGIKRVRSPRPGEGVKSKRRLGNNGKRTTTPDQNEGENAEGGRNSPTDIAGKKAGGNTQGKGGSTTKLSREQEPKPDIVGDHAQEGLVSARKAFSRVLGLWEGAAAEGKRGLHQRVIARLGRMLAEAEAAAVKRGVGSGSSPKGAGGKEDESEVVGEVATFLAQDYRKRFQAALALLTEMYVADVAAISAANMSSNSAPPKNSTDARPHGGKTPEGGVAQTENKARSTRQAKGFELYDKALVSLLTKLSGSLEPSWRQKLFTQTLLECPRVPPQALELVCSLCDMASKPCDIQTGLVTLKDIIFHKPATRNVCIPSVLRFTYHSDLDVRTKAVRLASNLLYPDPAFQPTIEAFAKQALASIKSPEAEKKEVKQEKEMEKPPSSGTDMATAEEEDVVDFEGDDEEELQPNPAKELTPTPDPTPADPLEVRIVGPWLAPPQTEASARVRLSLYFALCVKSRPMFAGLMEVFVTAAPAAQAGLMAELPLLAKAAAKGFGEAGVVGLMAAAPDGAKALVLAMLDLLVPREINKPSQELVAAVRRLRATRCTRAVEGAKMKGESGGAGGQAKVDEAGKTVGIEYVVPVLAGLGREGVMQELPALLQADDDLVKKAFRRLIQPAKGAAYTPAELIVLLNRFNYTAAGVPIKRLLRALTVCLENKTVYNYPVLREALNVMSQPPAAPDQNGGQGGTSQLPLLLMRTVMVSVGNFAELKNFVATAVLPRLVQQKVWTQPRIWDGFLICAKMMAKESGATSFIALVQLPAETLKSALALPHMKSLKEPLKHYAQTLIKVDPGVRAVLGLEQVANGSTR